jgi:hypothetical protein
MPTETETGNTDRSDPAMTVASGVINWVDLQHQRAAVLAVIVNVESLHSRTIEALDGVMNLLDHLADEASDAGFYDDADRRRWWAEGCRIHGLDAPDI